MSAPQPSETTQLKEVNYLWSINGGPFTEEVDRVRSAKDLALILYRKRVSLQGKESRGTVAFWKLDDDGTGGTIGLCAVDRNGAVHSDGPAAKNIIDNWISPAQREHLRAAPPQNVIEANLTRLIMIHKDLPHMEELLQDDATGTTLRHWTETCASAEGYDSLVWAAERLDKDTLSLTSYRPGGDPKFGSIDVADLRKSLKRSDSWDYAQNFLRGENLEPYSHGSA